MFCCLLTNYELKSTYCKYLIRWSRVCKFLKCCIVSSFFLKQLNGFPYIYVVFFCFLVVLIGQPVLISKKLAIFIPKMIDLHCTHPDVHAAFMKGLKNRWGVDMNVHGPFH